MTDSELLFKAQQYGQNALLWRRKFLGLLPEINARGLYRKKGFESIFEFAFKLAGVSEKQVRRVLNLREKFADQPALKHLLESGEVSSNKLARIASIATPQNEAALAAAVQALPQRAVEILVRDEKQLCEPTFEAKSVHAHTLQLGPVVMERLLELQNKGINIDEMLLELLDQREQQITNEKEDLAKSLPTTSSRHIPVQVKRLLQKEHGTKCSINTCSQPAEHLHHTQIFALGRSHDPHYLAPLCKNHHAIAHAINLKVREKRMEGIAP